MDHYKIKEKFIDLFNTEPLLVKSPGRINLIGEHTDYNDGYVLPAAINKNIYLALQKNDKNRIRIFASDLNESIDISAENVTKNKATWANYLLGSYQELIKAGCELQGFDCVFGGNLPIGAGLSSSAAIECGLIYGLNILYKLNLDKLHIAKLAQKAEHNFVGVKCGIMDQYAIINGKKDHALLLDCRSLESAYFPLKLDQYEVVLINSNVKHSLASSEYNTRRLECETGVGIIKEHFPEINSLRDVTIDQINQFKFQFNSGIYNRCEYVVEENKRVLEFSNELNNSNLKKIGKLLLQTHLGLRNKYEVSCKELDLLVDKATEMDFVLGSRMMGGGFGGCTINLVKKDKIELFKQAMEEFYIKETNITPDFYIVEITNGVEIVN